MYWLGVLPCVREQGARADIFAQASSFPLGENSRSLPKFFCSSVRPSEGLHFE